MTVIVKNKKDALKVTLGGAYYIDVWPDPPVTDQEAKNLEKRMAKAQEEHDALQAIIDNNLSEPLFVTAKSENPMLADVRNLTQAQFVKKYKVKEAAGLAKELGVKSTGREADIVQRIYEAVE